MAMAKRPDIASCPAKDAATLACSAVDKPSNPLLMSTMISLKDFIFPSESVIDNPSFSIAPCTSLVGLVSRDIMGLKAVPD